MRKIIFITGGQRSGKSSYAQKLALSLSDRPMYIATSAIWDDEHKKRIDRHKSDRSDKWITIEELTDIDKINIKGEVAVIDCVTLWSTNFFYSTNGDIEASLKLLIEKFDKFVAQQGTFIFITNEIGLGGINPNDLQRKFTDLVGWVNQHIAKSADQVILMVSGIPLIVKQ